MPEFDELANNKDYENRSIEKQKVLEDIQQIVINSKSVLEGNYFYKHNSLTLENEKLNKQRNLFWCGKQAVTKICEIGFNAGHSSMLMLLGREKTPLDFTIFDIGKHPYTKPCIQYMKSQFQYINFEYIEGDSTVTMPKWIAANTTCLGIYDVVHVDGGHTRECITNDMKYADLLVKRGGLVIIDDTNMNFINNAVNAYITNGQYREINILPTKGSCHRVIQKNK